MLAGPLPGIYDPTGPGRILFAFFAALAETERDNIREGTLEGLDAAARKGEHGGRPAVITADMLHTVLRRRAAGETVPPASSTQSTPSRPPGSRAAPSTGSSSRAALCSRVPHTETAGNREATFGDPSPGGNHPRYEPRSTAYRCFWSGNYGRAIRRHAASRAWCAISGVPKIAAVVIAPSARSAS
ncbi:recombinase family protein [Streptosporangium sp. NPDC000509]|uniref:recombinase family protein n=1 Tax=Streptosporangium sp. NPDC000509 TaxID=3366186 RepID=UPI00369C9598